MAGSVRKKDLQYFFLLNNNFFIHGENLYFTIKIECMLHAGLKQWIIFLHRTRYNNFVFNVHNKCSEGVYKEN